MSVEITRNAKNSISIQTPMMPAAGTFGFGDVYRDIIKVDLLGAIVTSPVTYEPWHPATGTKVVPLDSGVLVHTGLPNPGLHKTLKTYRNLWSMMPIPVILHLVATTPEQIRKSISRIDEEECIAGIELGLNDDISAQEAVKLVETAVSRGENRC